MRGPCRSSHRAEGRPHDPRATPAAIAEYGQQHTSSAALGYLRGQAEIHNGLDYLQVFQSPEKAEPLWFIEDGPGGAITALLPSDY